MDVIPTLGWLVPVLGLLFALANAIYTHSATKSRANRDELRSATAAADEKVEGLKAEVGALRERTRVLENSVASAPTRKEIAELHVAMERIDGNVRAMTEKMNGMGELAQVTRQQVTLMDQWLRTVPTQRAGKG